MTSKKHLRLQLGAIAVRNGWHSGNYNTPCSGFSAWWREVKDLLPYQIKGKFKESKFNQVNPDALQDLNYLNRAFITPHKEQITAILSNYNLTGFQQHSEIEHNHSCIYHDLLPVIGDALASRRIVELMTELTQRPMNHEVHR